MKKLRKAKNNWKQLTLKIVKHETKWKKIRNTKNNCIKSARTNKEKNENKKILKNNHKKYTILL